MTLMYQPSGSITIPNDDSLRIIQYATEVPGAAGTPVTPTSKLYGDLMLNVSKPLADRQEYGGGFDAWITPVYGPVDVDGTYSQPLGYEDLAILLKYGVKGQVTATTDGNPTPAYPYIYLPSRAVDDLDTFTAEIGFPGMPWTAAGLLFKDFTISADIEDTEAAWKWSGNLLAKSKTLKTATTFQPTSSTTTVITKTAAGWTPSAFVGAYVEVTAAVGVGQVRRVTANDATTITVSPAFVTAPDATSTIRISGQFTASISDRTVNRIDAPGTLVYIDDATIGTTLATQKIISWSVTLDNSAYLKRFMENTAGYSNKRGRGSRKLTGTVRMEFDTRDEYDNFVASTRRYLRFKKVGPAINVGPNTFYTAQIDVTNAFWDSPNVNDLRQENIVISLPFRGYYDSVAGGVGTFTAITRQATLP